LPSDSQFDDVKKSKKNHKISKQTVLGI